MERATQTWTSAPHQARDPSPGHRWVRLPGHWGPAYGPIVRPGGGVWLNGMLRRPGRCSVCSLPRLGARAGGGGNKKGGAFAPPFVTLDLP